MGSWLLLFLLHESGFSKVDPSVAKAEIKVLKVECLRSSERQTDYLATARVQKKLDGPLDEGSNLKILFSTTEKNAAVILLQGDEAIATLHKKSDHWVINSPADMQGTLLSGSMLPNCKWH